MTLIADRLRQRVRRGGAGPLVTYYDLGSGERTELSATSFLNWVDKTSNLLVEDDLITPGAVVDLALARQAPGHWVTLVVELAAWQVGATVRLGPAEAPPDLLVLGPTWQSSEVGEAGAVFACSLHPLGLGFAAPLPGSMVDFSVEVRGQPDVHVPAARSAGELAWVDDRRRLTQHDLVSLDVSGLGASRRLVNVIDPWSTTRDGLLVPLLTGGSAVLVVGDDPERLTRIRRDELVEE